MAKKTSGKKTTAPKAETKSKEALSKKLDTSTKVESNGDTSGKRIVECVSCSFEWTPKEEILVGEVISCPDCDEDLEVIEIKEKRIKVKRVKITAEDWGEEPDK